MFSTMPSPIRSLIPFCRKGEGTSAVEFALVAPFLILLTLGIIDFGRMMWAETTVEHLSREAGSPYAPRGPGCDFKDEVRPRAGEFVVQKSTNNAFIDTGLAAVRASGASIR